MTTPTSKDQTLKPARTPGLNRWNPLLPLFITALGSVTFLFAGGVESALKTFGLCFAVAYGSQIVFGRFVVALPLFTTVPTEKSGVPAAPRDSAA